MAVNPKKYVVPHKHTIRDIIDGKINQVGNSTSFNGGIITKPLELKTKFPYLDESIGDLYAWMFAEPTDLPDPETYIRLSDTNLTSNYTDIYGVIVDNGVDSAPAIAFNHHIVCRKDFTLRGMVNSYEGIVALHGGYADWAPTSNPMIWLAEGGFYGSKNNLEIRVVTDVIGSSFIWGWGGLKVGTVYVDSLKKIDGTDWNFTPEIDWDDIQDKPETFSPTIPITYGMTNFANQDLRTTATNIVFTKVSLKDRLVLKQQGVEDGYAIEVYVQMVADPLDSSILNPILYMTQGLWVQKDVYANGYVGSASPTGGTGGGCLMLGGGRFEHPNDPPRINLTSGATYVAITKGSTIQNGFDNWDLHSVLGDLRCNAVYTDYLKKNDGSDWNLGGVVNWSDIQNKPSAFTPTSHGNEKHSVNYPSPGISTSFTVWTELLVDGGGHVTGGHGKTLTFTNGVLTSASDTW
jgi:hypothetical protein